jgi:putative two-component system response regulator
VLSAWILENPLLTQKRLKLFKLERGKHFDPDMVDAFLEIAEDLRQIALEFADFDEERETLLS